MITVNRHGSTPILMLFPFSGEIPLKDCRIAARLSLGETTLQVEYRLYTNLANLIIPVFDPSKAERKNNLWEHTCFEIFLGEGGRSNYWEFNLSPSGEWNVYAFSDYREGMKQELSFDMLPFEVNILSGQELSLETTIDLDIIPVLSDLKTGISSVLEQKNGMKSYWALSHPGEVPDFHARESWIQV